MDVVVDQEQITNNSPDNEQENISKFSLFEISRFSWKNENNKQLYTRGCLWSPDGSFILTAVNLNGMYVFDVPSKIYESENFCTRQLDVLNNRIHVKEGGTVYDFCWYPLMNSDASETCCWIATRQNEPIHMWDALNGKILCSYRGYDNVDECEAAISVSFTNNGNKILSGYKKSIKIFDTRIPGRNYTQIDIKQPCSCFAIHKFYDNLIMTGSWKSTINMYDLRVPQSNCLSTFTQHVGGVTYLKFSKDNNSLFSGARKDNQLIEWDVRNIIKPVTILKRNVGTNQKIYFDLSPSDEWLISGDTSGYIRAWNLIDNYNENLLLLHNDCCNGISIHPTKSILATSSGQYHFLKEDKNDDEEEESVEIYENSLTIWWHKKMI